MLNCKACDYNTCVDEQGVIIQPGECGSSTITSGDANAHLGCEGGPRCRKVPNSHGKAFEKFVNECGLEEANLKEGTNINTYRPLF